MYVNYLDIIAQTINYNFGNEMSENYIQNSLFDDFKRKYIDFTMPVRNYVEFEYLIITLIILLLVLTRCGDIKL